jgi:NAD(P)-dependent dehydrogenase (short-subunit alcohol dehydrogenase family)
MKYLLTGKTVLITGAAGGIGAATARELHARGANLVLTDMFQPALDKLAAEFDASRVLPVAVDVTDMNAVKAAIEKAVAKFGRLDIAFANAGISWRGVPATQYTCDEQEFRRIVEVDLFGVWHAIKAALPEVRRNQGQILVTSSIYAFMNGMANAPYAASKAAVEMLTRALRAELSGTGATASVLYPGWVATPIAHTAFGGNELATRMVATAFPAPLRRPIQPEQIARGVADGLEKRRPRMFIPFRWVPLSWLRGIFAILTDWGLDRHRGMQGMLRELEAQSGGKES